MFSPLPPGSDNPEVFPVPIVHAYAAQDAHSPLAPFQIERRELRPQDVQIEILYSGVCHSDIHQARSEWGPS
ncbi:hypothetical protein ACFFLM_22615 [Deinococcus oregonensis]|uniref:Alcohol dehydrogenase N-terminal domain-containing protein n=1 Tax=Deinococcus oregonensis TaxID=1805970 RepID=A0ABV6B783_9DEIO